MCKFNNYIFVFLVVLVHHTIAAPFQKHRKGGIKSKDYSDYYDDYDYDLFYDQRQNGTENLRVVIDGVVVAVPSSSGSSNAETLESLAAEYLFGDLYSSNASPSASGNHDEEESNGDHQHGLTTSHKDPPYDFQPIVNKDKPSTTTSVGDLEMEKEKPVVVLVETKPTLLPENSYNKESVDNKKEGEAKGIQQQKRKNNGQKKRNRFRILSMLKPLLQRRIFSGGERD